MTLFLASLAGIPPLAGWFAKFVMFRSIIECRHGLGLSRSASIAAVNSVIAFFYYFRRRPADVVPRARRPTTARRSACRSRSPVAIALTVAVVVVVGIYPQLFARIGELAF